MDKKHEKAMLDLERILKTQDFKNLEEAQEFINKNLMGQTIPTFDKEALTPEERAQDLVYDAIEEEDVLKADALIHQALLLDPDCVEAYEYLGDLCGSTTAALLLYKNGYTAARKKLGEKFFKKNKGMFWGIHETRPFMRCLNSYAECLYRLDQKAVALDVFFELLELNPNDNQGIRDQAGLYCLELEQWDRYLKLQYNYKDDSTAFHFFNYALYLFLTSADTEESRAAATRARHHNKHVVQLMNSRKPLPLMTSTYGLGDKSEAIYYCTIARDIWKSKPGAVDWLVSTYLKP